MNPGTILSPPKPLAEPRWTKGGLNLTAVTTEGTRQSAYRGSLQHYWREGDMILATLPYLLLLIFFLTAWPLTWLFGTQGAFEWWTKARWLVRLVLLVGAPLLWHYHRLLFTVPGANARSPRLWLYSWLAFVVYEIVAILLTVSTFILNELTAFGTFAVLSGLVIMGLAFVPYIILAIGLGGRDAQLAAYTVFPLAALAGELFYFGILGQLAQRIEWDFLTAAFAPVAVTALVHVLLFPFAQTSNHRWWLLYGGVVVVQVAFVLGFVWQNGALWMLLLAIPLSMLGIAVLVSPAVLSGLWTMGVQLVDRLGGATLRHQLQQRFVSWWPLPVIPRSVNVFVLNVFGGRIVSESMREESPMEESVAEQATVVSPVTTASTGMGGTSGRPPTVPPPNQPIGRGMERLYKLSVIILAAMIVLGVILFVGRAAVYKIHEYERGLHLRGGRFMAIQDPGWHIQIPLVDTVIIVKINERLGYIEQIPAMTSDNVTMIVSLQYTYRVIEPEQYALQVDDPERIVFEFVQGKLRDVVNTKAMADVMNDRALMNQEVMEALKGKEEQYGVRFVTVQMQSASPPEEVLTAIKDRMVAVQRQEQAQAEAAQQRTLAEAELYSAQKRADARAYEITHTAEADAERIRLMTEAQQLSIRTVIDELDGKGELANKFLDYLIAQELRENSKWIINGEGTPLVNVQE